MFLSAQELQRVKQILRTHVPTLTVWAFGSRVHGRHLKPFSDLDLALITATELPWDKYTALKEAFSESDLPFRVDIIDWFTTSAHFRAIIQQEYCLIQTPGVTE
ncbi:hypothetical protein THII_2036 [Thioploca ingrica]|uniref:Polymerase beta nucleotidyltransferase domain-containing protein n=1 Tax=Thioploca ingrica TaxID=40754 RepID=A0A090AEE5_9GAMM|nr:hypothetical protein THII_2036 [Thioploca ingrica]